MRPAAYYIPGPSEFGRSRIVDHWYFEEVESDFSKSLAQLSLAEEEAEIGYQKITKENIATEVSRERDVKCEEHERQI